MNWVDTSLVQSKLPIIFLQSQSSSSLWPLQSTKKGSLSIDEYFLKMKKYGDSLDAADHPISDEDLILYFLGGLGSEYESVVFKEVLVMEVNVMVEKIMDLTEEEVEPFTLIEEAEDKRTSQVLLQGTLSEDLYKFQLPCSRTVTSFPPQSTPPNKSGPQMDDTFALLDMVDVDPKRGEAVLAAEVPGVLVTPRGPAGIEEQTKWSAKAKILKRRLDENQDGALQGEYSTQVHNLNLDPMMVWFSNFLGSSLAPFAFDIVNNLVSDLVQLPAKRCVACASSNKIYQAQNLSLVLASVGRLSKNLIDQGHAAATLDGLLEIQAKLKWAKEEVETLKDDVLT
uniref:Uncharacterized protein n=1 Tax=Cannabis sativa TaxID=3483 RepID=A0A803P149_CANSA